MNGMSELRWRESIILFIFFVLADVSIITMTGMVSNGSDLPTRMVNIYSIGIVYLWRMVFGLLCGVIIINFGIMNRIAIILGIVSSVSTIAIVRCVEMVFIRGEIKFFLVSAIIGYIIIELGLFFGVMISKYIKI